MMSSIEAVLQYSNRIIISKLEYAIFKVNIHYTLSNSLKLSSTLVAQYIKKNSIELLFKTIPITLRKKSNKIQSDPSKNNSAITCGSIVKPTRNVCNSTAIVANRNLRSHVQACKTLMTNKHSTFIAKIHR